MTDTGKRPPRAPHPSQAEQRARRLESALRDNLRKRKDKARSVPQDGEAEKDVPQA